MFVLPLERALARSNQRCVPHRGRLQQSAWWHSAQFQLAVNATHSCRPSMPKIALRAEAMQFLTPQYRRLPLPRTV